MTIHVYLMTEISCAKYIVKNILVFSLKSESKQFFSYQRLKGRWVILKKKGKVNELCNPFYRIGNPFLQIVIRSLKFDNLFSPIALALVPVIYTIRSLKIAFRSLD